MCHQQAGQCHGVINGTRDVKTWSEGHCRREGQALTIRIRVAITIGIRVGPRNQRVCEAWTSKTCGVCGKINYGLGSKRVFECRPGCGFRADRDGGAARSIFIRYGTGVDAKRLLGS
eukprot:tig00020554_g10927.t1